jgi:hypothetical protein
MGLRSQVTKDELGASEYFASLGYIGMMCQVDAASISDYIRS